MIKVKNYGIIKNWSGHKKLEFNKEKIELREIIHLVIKKSNKALRKNIINEKGIEDFVIITINGENIQNLNGLSTKLKGNEEIRLAPSVAGGKNRFTDKQVKRYGRHIVLPEIGGEGQKKLTESKILVVGAGALGSAALQYLASAGIGKIGIIDNDKVELSNLQRQTIHQTKDIGNKKTESAKQTIKSINPEVKVKTHNKRLKPSNAQEIIKKWDFIIDGSDNFPTKYLINDSCFLENKPFSHAGILKFTGLTTTFIPNQGPCYRCLSPQPPPEDAVPSCQEAGVVGALPGVIGSIQAMEAIKYTINQGKLLNGKVIYFDALEMSFNEMLFEKNKNCSLCKNQEIKNVSEIEYNESCRVNFDG